MSSIFGRKEPLPVEYEEMKQSSLFSNEEVRILINRRRSYDYKIEKQLKSVRDYLEYIKYEREIVKMINDRNKNKQLKPIKYVETIVATRIVTLYEKAVLHFPEERKLWEAFYKFCTTFKRNEFSSYLRKWIENHGDDPEVWFTVLRWESDHNENIDVIRSHIVEGIQRHPRSHELHSTIFHIELKEIAKQTAKPNDSFDRLRNIYENSKNDIFCIEFVIEILAICEEYLFTGRLQNYVINDLTLLFPSHYLTWKTLALRELKGFHLVQIYKIEEDEEKYDDKKTYSYAKRRKPNETIESFYKNRSKHKNLNQPKEKDKEIVNDYDFQIPEKLTMKKRIEHCVKIFHRGGTLLKTEVMWTHYIDAMLELNKDLSTQKLLKHKCLLNAYNGGHEVKCLTEKQYLDYIDLLQEEEEPNKELLVAVFNQSTTMYPYSIDLWLIFMRHCIMQDRRETIFDTFYRGLRGVNIQDSIRLWQILIQYSLTKFDRPTKIVEVYKEAIKQPSPVSDHFKPLYLEWLSIGKSITEARNVFDEIYEKKPHCYELHRTMIALNMRLLRNSNRVHTPNKEDNFKHAKHAFEVTIKLFGSTKPELWIDYIKFETEYADVKNKQKLIDFALDKLDSEHRLTFAKLNDLLNI